LVGTMTTRKGVTMKRTITVAGSILSTMGVASA